MLPESWSTFQICADVDKMLAKQTLANTCQISVRPQAPIAQVSRGGGVAACGGSQKENGTFPKTPVKSLDEAL